MEARSPSSLISDAELMHVLCGCVVTEELLGQRHCSQPPSERDRVSLWFLSFYRVDDGEQRRPRLCDAMMYNVVFRNAECAS